MSDLDTVNQYRARAGLPPLHSLEYEPKVKKEAKSNMHRILNSLVTKLETTMDSIVSGYTRVKFKNDDWNYYAKCTEEGIILKATPKSEYGHFILKQLSDQITEHELTDGKGHE